jgi:glycine/D-amino acid oxidase-like deaminating enzyme
MSESAEVVIIGGGIVGCAAAYYLAKRGVPATVCEKGVVAGEQSSRNWGFVRQQGRDPVEIPLMIECNRMWRGLEAEIEADIEWIQGGNLVLGDDEARMAEFEGWVEEARRHQLESRVLTRKEIESLIPGIRTSAVGGLYTPSDGQAEPQKVAPAIRRAAERLGATFHEDRAVLSVETERGAVSGVVTESGEISTRSVICAAGAWSGRLARTMGLVLPQIWVRATVARTTPAKAVTPAGVWAGLAFRQLRDGSFNIASGTGADHDITLESLRNFPPFLPAYRQNRGFLTPRLGRPFLDHLPGRFSRAAQGREYMRMRTLDPPPNPARVANALATLHQTFPGLGEVSVVRSWAGYIDFTPDMLPVIDRLERPAGFILATGFSGHGFGMGPIAGRLAAELALDGRASLDTHAFRFARFSDGTRLAPRNVI